MTSEEDLTQFVKHTINLGIMLFVPKKLFVLVSFFPFSYPHRQVTYLKVPLVDLLREEGKNGMKCVCS